MPGELIILLSIAMLAYSSNVLMTLDERLLSTKRALSVIIPSAVLVVVSLLAILKTLVESF